MNYYIKELSLDYENFRGYIFNEEWMLRNLSKINIFVGSNNSGKSNFLRNIVLDKNGLFVPNAINLENYNELTKRFKKELETIIKHHNIIDYGDFIEKSQESLSELKFLSVNEDYQNPFRNMLEQLKNIKTVLLVTTNESSPFFDGSQLNNQLRKLGGTFSTYLEDWIKEGNSISKSEIPRKYNFKKVYIPTLRGLRVYKVKDGEDKEPRHVDLYERRTKVDYFNKENHEFEIFTGLNLYEEVKSLLLGSLRKRQLIREFEKFLGNSFFDGKEVSLIPSISSDVLHVKIGSEVERPIYNLGDGIQSIIIMTFPLFKYKDQNLLLFIEEPETFLHPGLQRTLLETFMKNEFGNHQYFLTTHSNHFLDITLDVEQISVFTFNKELEVGDSNEKLAKFVIENVNNEETSILELLGVKDSSVFLSNCTIWIEGITDRYYIRHYLNLYQKYIGQEKGGIYKEDLNFSFIEYSGGNITHWSFLDDEEVEIDEKYKSTNFIKISKKIFLISDKDGEEKGGRQEKLAENLGDNYYCLNSREIENLISKEVLLSVIADYEGTKVEELEFQKKDFTEEDYKDEYLGAFIQDQLINKKRRGNYYSSSGTISSKLNFSKKVIKYTNKYEDLTAEVQQLCEKIYTFIQKNN
ncbi:ATP-binding protein [Bacillus wiedmannii]|uniref:AAA family ATPase n=1 Tax=Bacillus wiedmannii TaxID=1890302 RepID=UPI0021D3492F|nr:ATP-binding protein [Bacillus wiedmannii]MCU5110827.1 ATP-binding protein [Bacillus wiedmannii]MCU5150421.1 ATP-binding protein [Bacillus wiedmannii]MCU5410777.1 ATP-binding protein [Bacillus wiedmannii]